MLDAAAKAKPNATWWIKGDACDVIPGLCESMQLKWSGDVDLNDGNVEHNYQQYKSRLQMVSTLGLGMRRVRPIFKNDLSTVHQHLLKDKDFIVRELASANEKYHNKLLSNEKDSKSLFALGWKVEELKRFVEKCQILIASASSLQDIATDATSNFESLNLPSQLDTFRSSLSTFVRNLSRHQRVQATHLFVFMISCDKRDSKPYAVPVQCFPCNSLTHSKLRQLINELIKEMKSRGMKVAGFCSDGEFNTLRNRGYTRPLSVFAIRSDVRSKYARMSVATMKAMLTPEVCPNGQVEAVLSNPAVPAALLTEISLWLSQGLQWNDIISRLRPRTVPPGYAYNSWKPGKEETQVEMFRSVLAQLEFTYIVQKYDASGVPFTTHLHVPEVHPLTGSIFYEREDEGHVLKRICRCTRNGGPSQLQLERYVEAVQSSDAGLTYPALIGSRKQSVEDAERMFSPSLLKFMEDKGYQYEAEYIRAVLGWRTVSSICGFTREVLSALAADIETREWRRCLNDVLGPEHPRSSTSDDVECFFSVMRDMVGANFTVKQAQIAWRKVCIEFEKRIDDTLPFYYFTSSHDRFYEVSRPSFDKPSERKKNPRRLPRSEQVIPASLSSGRATLPVRGTLTIRPRFHKGPVHVPPPSTSLVHTVEHSYSRKTVK
jgi:hypothetical protein